MIAKIVPMIHKTLNIPLAIINFVVLDKIRFDAAVEEDEIFSPAFNCRNVRVPTMKNRRVVLPRIIA